jgi:hypothetical protein
MGYVQGQWTPTKRRGPIAAEFTGPGPASISLPTLIGGTSKESNKSNAPSFSLHGRPKNRLDNVGPGPATYDLTALTHTGKCHPGGTVISGRLKEPSAFVTPAPSDYTPEKSDDSTHGVSPKFSFGLKGKDAKPENVPAPNKYNIPGLLGTQVKEGSKRQSPSYTLSGRNKQPPPQKTPGPGTYNTIDADMIKKKSPRYTLSTRYELPSDKTKVPGPGAFSPEKVNLDGAPHVSFGIRHSPYIGHLPEKQAKNM